MLLLAVDTSGKPGMIALARGNVDATCGVIEAMELDGSAFSAQLVPRISSLLSKNGFGKNDLDGFVVVSGPGSFTGLRVGLAAIKALADVLQKPIAEVSILRAIAACGQFEQKAIAALNAGRNQIYLLEYAGHSGGALCSSERLVTQGEFLAQLPGANVVTPDVNIGSEARALGATVQLVHPQVTETIAKLGLQKILSGEPISPEALEANYTGRSNSDIFSKA